MTKRFFFLLLLSLPVMAGAQTNPLASEQEIGERLFRIQEPINHSFTISLPGKCFLLVEFSKLSDWQDNGAFRTVVQEAAKISLRMKDSLKQPTASYRLDMHLPVGNTPVTARVTEQAGSTNFVMLNDHDQAPLKIGMDTVNVLKTLRYEKSNTRKMQVQYTFILKEMNQMQELAANEHWMNETAAFLDSVVFSYRRRWHNQDAWHHQLFVSYRPEETEPQKRLVINEAKDKNEPTGIFKMLFYDVGFGVSLLRNTLSPVSEFGFTVVLYRDKTSSFFTRVSANSFALFEREPDGNFKGYSSSFVNIEFGTTNEKSIYALPLYLASIGFGVKIDGKYDHPSFERDWYKLFFRYNITKTFSVRPEFYLTPKRKDDGFLGIGFNLRIL